MNSGKSCGMRMLTGAAVGAAAMYLLDPVSGPHRRRVLGDVTNELADGASEALGVAWDRTRSASAVAAARTADVSHRVADRASDWAQRLGDRAGEWSGDLPARAGRMTHGARHRLAKAIDPEHVRGPGHAAGWSAAGVGMLALGAGLMYFLDPDRGLARRNRATRTVQRFLGDAGQTFRRAGHQCMCAVRGTASELTASSGTGGSVGEDLLRNCRGAVTAVLTYPAQVQLMADDHGTVTVYGRVLAHEEDRLLSALYAVAGVRQIVNRTEPRTSGAEVISPADPASAAMSAGSTVSVATAAGGTTTTGDVPAL